MKMCIGEILIYDGKRCLGRWGDDLNGHLPKPYYRIAIGPYGPQDIAGVVSLNPTERGSSVG